MRSTFGKISTQKATMVLFAVLLVFVLLSRPGQIRAQRPLPPVAEVGAGFPLPVYVVNDPRPLLPDGFVPGSSWKFTTWTTPSTLTFTATVRKTEGGWALLALNGDTATAPRWYYILHMPGAWEAQ
jgi:hypothetical protein